MERVNSWGREIKDKFSVSFKKDEEDLKLFLNEQPSPVEYLKVLVRKDMAGMKDINIAKPMESINSKVSNTTKVEDNIQDSEPELNSKAIERLMQMMDN